MSPGRQFGILWGAVATALVALSPLAPKLAGMLPACPLKTLAGLPCPGCGSTRVALALSRIDLGSAVAVSPLATAAMVFLVAGGLVAGVLALAGIEVPEPPRLDGRRLWVARGVVIGAVALNWLYLLYTGV